MKTYRSKIDLWIFAIIFVPLLLLIVAMGFVGEGFWFVTTICGLCALLSVWLYWGTKYVIDEDMLKIHAGLYKINIPIESIKSVKKTRNPLSSPAFSLDRLEISYESSSKVLISPRDKTQFLNDIGFSHSL